MKTRELTMRFYHESKYHDASVFCTFTYNEVELPRNSQGIPTLRKEDFQLFMKRLRKALSPRKVRVFYCGEYGGQTNRPHYHAILFGCSTKDTDLITKEWRHGFTSVSDLTYGRCGYVAKYLLKNEVFSYDYCINLNIEPQFVQSSTRPGIGAQFIKDNMYNVSQDGNIMFRGRQRPIPRYYFKKIKELDDNINLVYFFKNLAFHIKDLKLDPLKLVFKDRFIEQARRKQLELNKVTEFKLKGI